MALNPAFKAQMFKASNREFKNLGRMKTKDIRAEYTRQSKVANKRITAIVKSGMYSHALNQLNQRGITKFGIKNQNLMSDSEIKTAYKELMSFLNNVTSSKSGIRATIDKMVQNFNMPFDGDYIGVSNKSRKLFDLYDDLKQLEQKGQIKNADKYDIVHDLGTLYDDGLIDENTTANDVLNTLKAMAQKRYEAENKQYEQLRFKWNV